MDRVHPRPGHTQSQCPILTTFGNDPDDDDDPCAVIDDPDGLLGAHSDTCYDSYDCNPAAGKSATVRPVLVDLLADSNRDGVIDEQEDDQDEDVWEYGPAGRGAIMLCNSDDDDSAGLDAIDETVNGAGDVDDITPLLVRKMPDLPEGWSMEIEVTENPHAVRIFDAREAGAAALVTPAAPETNPAPLPAELVEGEGWLELGLEAVIYPGWPDPAFDGLVTVELRALDETGVEQCSDSVRLRVAPWLMPSHADQVDTVYVTNRFGARQATDPAGAAPPFVDRLNAALAPTGLAATVIPSSDPWPQDQYELGFHSAPGGAWSTVLLNSPRFGYDGESLRLHAQDALLGTDFGLYGTPVDSGDWTAPASTYDSFGNLEALPPLGLWSSGRVYHGSGMQADLAGFLGAQHVQGNPPVTLDTSWLLVGHVDEFITIQATGPDTFRAIVASPMDARALLQADPNHQFDDQLWNRLDTDRPPDEGGYAPLTAAQLDETYGRFQQDYQDDIDDAANDLLDLGATGIVRVPVFFACLGEDAEGNPNGDKAVAALPGMVNLLNVNGTLIVPDPVYQPFRDAFTNALGAGATIRWIDCLEYHWRDGEVHCATNTRRVPRQEITRWWNIEQ